MARLARIVVPGVAHHVMQRGNRGQPVFFGEGDAQLYVDLIAAALQRTGTRCLAWCLMPNHVHLILVPSTGDGLRATLGEAHRRYSRSVNTAHGWTGYLWQGRFVSYPMEQSHLRNAVLFVERTPVAAGLAIRAEDWRWSSAKAHVCGIDDGLTDRMGLDTRGLDWSRELTSRDMETSIFEAHARTGRPLGDTAFLKRLEDETGRALQPRKRGRKAAAAKK